MIGTARGWAIGAFTLAALALAASAATAWLFYRHVTNDPPVGVTLTKGLLAESADGKSPVAPSAALERIGKRMSGRWIMIVAIMRDGERHAGDDNCQSKFNTVTVSGNYIYTEDQAHKYKYPIVGYSEDAIVFFNEKKIEWSLADRDTMLVSKIDDIRWESRRC